MRALLDDKKKHKKTAAAFRENFVFLNVDGDELRVVAELPGTCEAQCGNSVTEYPEDCDDGNDDDTDTCPNNCEDSDE